MSHVKGVPDVSNVENWKDLRRFTAIGFERFLLELNGGLNLVDNIFASGPFEVTFASASDVQQVNHGLGVVPTGYLVVKLNAAITVYQPSGTANAWQSDKIFLQSSGAGTATIFVI